jgi:uncharacterized paraquat-inducible protein A
MVMLGFAVVLAIVSFALELMIVFKLPGLRRAVQDSLFVNLFFSLGLSFILGMMFGANGLVVMTAALLSTAGSVPVYKTFNLFEREKKDDLDDRHGEDNEGTEGSLEHCNNCNEIWFKEGNERSCPTCRTSIGVSRN